MFIVCNVLNELKITNYDVLSSYQLNEKVQIKNDLPSFDIMIIVKMIENLSYDLSIELIYNELLDILSTIGINIEIIKNENSITIHVLNTQYINIYNAEMPFNMTYQNHNELIDYMRNIDAYTDLTYNIFARYQLKSNIKIIQHHIFLKYGIKLLFQVDPLTMQYIVLSIINNTQHTSLYDFSNNLNSSDLFNISSQYIQSSILNPVIAMSGLKSFAAYNINQKAQLQEMIVRYMNIYGYSGEPIQLQEYLNKNILKPTSYYKMIINSENKLQTRNVYIYGLDTNSKLYKNLYKTIYRYKNNNTYTICKYLIDMYLYETNKVCNYVFYENNLTNNTRNMHVYISDTHNNILEELNFGLFNIDVLKLHELASNYDIGPQLIINDIKLNTFVSILQKIFIVKPDINQEQNILNISHGVVVEKWQPIWNDITSNLSMSSQNGLNIAIGTLNLPTIRNTLHTIIFKPTIELKFWSVGFNPNMDYYTIIKNGILLHANVSIFIDFINIYQKILLKSIPAIDTPIKEWRSIINVPMSVDFTHNITNKLSLTFNTSLIINKNLNKIINIMKEKYQDAKIEDKYNTWLLPSLTTNVKFVYNAFTSYNKALNGDGNIELICNSINLPTININTNLFHYYETKNHMICTKTICYLGLNGDEYLSAYDNYNIIKYIGYDEKEYMLTSKAIGINTFILRDLIDSVAYIGQYIGGLCYGFYGQMYFAHLYQFDTKTNVLYSLISFGPMIGIHFQGHLFLICICIFLDYATNSWNWKITFSMQREIHNQTIRHAKKAQSIYIT